MTHLFRKKRKSIGLQELVRRDRQLLPDPQNIVRRQIKIYVPAALVETFQVGAAFEDKAFICPDRS
jgi:hypothetical protein